LHIKYVDAHCHAHEYDEGRLAKYNHILLLSVGDDYTSSVRNMELEEKYSNIIGGIGVHPWSIGYEVSIEEVDKTIELALNMKPKMIGEIGLDNRFRLKTIELQRKAFIKFLELASSLKNVIVNVHALGTWSEVFQELTNYNIRVAIFHWYTGPINLLKEIESQGYYITINPSIIFQKRHKEVLLSAPLNIILTESDGPYKYRGQLLHSGMIPKLIEYIAKIKVMDVEETRKMVNNNVKGMLKCIGISINLA